MRQIKATDLLTCTTSVGDVWALMVVFTIRLNTPDPIRCKQIS
jgi:hypothetical protein